MICVQEVYGGAFLRTIVVGSEGRRIEQRKKLNCDRVSTKHTTDSTGRSKAGMVFQICPKLGKGGWNFMPTH